MTILELNTRGGFQNAIHHKGIFFLEGIEENRIINKIKITKE